MADKRLNARVQLKNDTEANWLKATNFVPLDGEFIVYDVDDTHVKPRFKVGDGKTPVSSLPFSEPDVAGELLGLVKSGGDVTITNGIITVNDDSHAHVIDNIDGLRTELDSKVAAINGKGLSTNDFTTDEKNKLSSIDAGAQVNQNAFSQVVVGQTTMVADNSTDTLTLVAGSNIMLNADPNTDTVTISSFGGGNGIDVDGVIEVLQAKSAYFDTESDVTEGTPPPLNADTLGGKLPSQYVLKGETVENANNAGKLGGKAPEYYLQPVNQLDNSNFANLVAQSGLNANHGTTLYVCDRWKSGNATIEQKSDRATLSTLQRAGRITQVLPLTFAGKTITVAAKVSGSSTVYVGIYYDADGSTYSISKSVNAPNGSIIFNTGTIPANANHIEFRIYPSYVDGGGSCDVYWAAMYEGSYTAETLPPYVPKGYGAELAECQRYYVKIADTYGRPIGFGMTYGATNGRILIPTPVTMRDVPSIIATPSNLRLTINGKQYTVSTIGDRSLWGNGIVATFTAADAPSNYPCTLFMAASETFALSADL